MMTLSFKMALYGFLASVICGFFLSPVYCIKSIIFKKEHKNLGRNDKEQNTSRGKARTDRRLFLIISNHIFDFCTIVICAVVLLMIAYAFTDGIVTVYSVVGFVLSFYASTNMLEYFVVRTEALVSKHKKTRNVYK